MPGIPDLPFFRVVRLFGRKVLKKLAAEVAARSTSAGAFRFPSHPVRKKHQDTPPFWLETAEGGAALTDVVTGRSTLDLLRRATGRRWLPRRKGGSYVYYRRPSQSFGLHRDARECELAMITCIVDRPGRGGDLVLYPGRGGESIPAILATPRRGALRIRLKPGESLLLDGRRIAHRVTRLGRRRLRVTATTCYAAAK